jgi:hypothetical protein
MGEKLAASASGPVTTVWIDQAAHKHFFENGGPQIDEAIARFVKELQSRSGFPDLQRSRGIFLELFLQGVRHPPEHTRNPSAPARCASAVSGVITRSRWVMMAAVSMKSWHRRLGSSMTGNCRSAALS